MHAKIKINGKSKHLFHILGLLCVDPENIRALGVLQSLCILVAAFSPVWRARKKQHPLDYFVPGIFNPLTLLR